MKKFIFSALAAIGLWLTPSCSDDNEALSGSGNEALVSFNVNLADGISTKAKISDGTQATYLVVEVYEAGAAENADQVFRIADQELSDRKGSVNFTLVKGKKYDLIFWAQNQDPETTALEECYYDVSDLRHIKVNYEANGGKSNNEDRDAFLYVEKNFSVDGPFERTVYLTRPFAQVNFMVPAQDINDAKDADFDFSTAQTGVTFKQVATQLNTLANTVEGADNVTFAAATIPFVGSLLNIPSSDEANNGVDKIKLPNNESGKYYYYLATNYILVNTSSAEANTQELISATLQINEGETEINKINVSNMPVQWNHRTNIYGNLLTTSGQFNVEINQNYENLDHGFAETVTVETTDAITEAITNGARTITCSANIDNDVTISIPKVFEAYTNGVDSDSKVVIRFTGAIADGKKVTIKYGEGTQAPKFVDINANGGRWVYELGESTVTMNGGEVENVTSTTSENTLIISQGLTVKGYIEAKLGGLKILGKVLGEDSESAIIMDRNNESGNLEIQGEVNGHITANNNATITITSTASIKGNVTANNNITVQGSVNGDVKSTGESGKVVIEKSATITGKVDGKNVDASTKANVNISNINSENASNTTTFKIGKAEELIAFAQKVNNDGVTYAGKTVELTDNIDLNNMFWAPIGPNADGNNKFKGTFDGQGYTISNLKVQQGAAYHAAGFFGALNGTAKNFTIDGATISNTSAPNGEGNTDNGTAVVAGSIYQSGAIEEVTVRNAKVNGNRYVGGIAGYVYGSIKNCTVESSTITSTPDNLTGSYDNGDKAGGIVGYLAESSTVTNCSVNNVTIQAYRDLGGIAGFTGNKDNVTGCTVSNVKLIQDYSLISTPQNTVGAIIGRYDVNRISYCYDGEFAEQVTKKVVGTISNETQLKSALFSTFANEIDIILAYDATVDIAPWGTGTNPYVWGGSATTAVSITGKTGNETLTFNNVNSDWNYVACANEFAQINISKLKLTNSDHNDGPWNRHDVYFHNPVTLTNVYSDKAIAVRADAALDKVTITDQRDDNDDYGLWIEAYGQTVTVKDCTFDMIKNNGKTGRAITIKDQYIDSPSLVTLNVSGTTFKSQKKAAVLVTSTAGANITWGENNDISEVQDDTENAVWNDADRTAAWNLVTVTGCTKKQEE